MMHIQQAIDGRPFGRKPFVVLQGAPGSGKSWLLAQIRQTLQANGVRCAEIVQASTLLDTPEAVLIDLLRWCLDDPTALVTGTTSAAEIVQELSNRLNHRLQQADKQPLALFFEDLDYWVGLSDKYLQRIYQQLWWVLLRHTQLPGLVICTSRESLPAARFSPGMKRKQQLIALQPLGPGEIDHLTTGILQEPASPLNDLASVDAREELQRLVKRYACGHPLIPDWLVWKLSVEPEAFQDHKRGRSLRELADEIIGDRLDSAHVDTLIRLVRERPQGFADDDPILEAGGPALVRLFIQVGLVKSVSGTYQVLPPLACLYKEEANG